jgi:TrmH family RNA methyltransferase
MRAWQRVGSRNARFQQWQTLLTNRTKRQRAGRFLVQGVRPITLAVEQRWPVHEFLVDADRRLSRWAEELLRTTDAEVVALPADLIAELGEKEQDAAPELVGVVEMPPDDLARIRAKDAGGAGGTGAGFLGIAFDRPSQPGNIGTLIRSADAFGADGVIVTGHAADVYDPRAVRASTGSLFGTPTVRTPSHREVLDWLAGSGVTIVGTDEDGDTDIEDYDFSAPTLIVVGNETVGMSAAWREACDRVLSIPMSGTASSLNAANAATVVLYEAARQRRKTRS